MGGLQPAIESGEPLPPVQILPPLIDASAGLGIAYVQAIAASLIGGLLGRTYRWYWASGGTGITLTGANTSIVTLTSLSLTPGTRTGVLQLEVTGPAMVRNFVVPVTIRHG